MNAIQKSIFEYVIGVSNPNSEELMFFVTNFHNDIEIKFEELEEDYKNDNNSNYLPEVSLCHKYFEYLYRKSITDIINEFFAEEYGKSFEYVLSGIDYDQSDVLYSLNEFLNKKGYTQEYINDVTISLNNIAEKVDKRFSFDDLALLNLIEAASGKNIIEETGSINRNNSRVVYSNGTNYRYKNSQTKNVYTEGGRVILDPKGPIRLEERNIKISSYPLGKLYINETAALNKVMNTLFDNINLCIEIYNSKYVRGNNVIENTAYLADGRQFNFNYIVNEKNIPHLFGIPRPNRGELSQDAIDALNSFTQNEEDKIKPTSTAFDLLKYILKYQNDIISCSGLYVYNNKKYQLINWERVILKTSSFMRSDFFRTCFCLAKLADDKFLVDPSQRGGYVSISSTKYNKGLNTYKSNGGILNDLINNRRQKRDFIFRGFKDLQDGTRIINTIMTGKAETIRMSQDNSLLLTLQKYRELFSQDSSGTPVYPNEYEDPIFNPTEGVNDSGGQGGSYGDSESDTPVIAQAIENDYNLKEYSPLEQADLGLSILRDLGIKPLISPEAGQTLASLNLYNGSVSEEEIETLLSDRGNNPNKKK